MHASGHDPGDGSEPENEQTMQATNVARGAHHREDGATAEARSGAQEASKARRVSERHRRAFEELQGLSSSERGQARQTGQGRDQLAHEHGAHTKEGAGAPREGAHEAAHGRGRGGLPQARQREEGQTSRLLAAADRRVHRLARQARHRASGRRHEAQEQAQGKEKDRRRNYYSTNHLIIYLN